MKIIITGSLGNISRPLAESLVQKGHEITVISSNPEKKKDIEDIGATAAIGSLEDVDFLIKTFTGAEAVYCMVPPNNYFDPKLNLVEYYRRLGRNYKRAVGESGVKRVVNLSTIGANLSKGNGILLGAHYVHHILNELPEDVSVIHLRPTSFFYNLYGYTQSIKTKGVIAANYGADDMIPWVSTLDIAEAAEEEIVSSQVGRKVRYVVSEELSGNETAAILGAAIGKPGLKWIVTGDEEMLAELKSFGMNPDIAIGLVEMYAGLHSGLLLEHYYQNRPAVTGKVKAKDFAKDFAAAYQQG
ncbi:MAG: NAD(P)H-binding protein [Gemmatimonadaceae bacterium]|nr:NAD(P)H-binding protein [Chitinophagaceae bacterium]